jgi:predicted alpha/beta-fold hydrolase
VRSPEAGDNLNSRVSFVPADYRPRFTGGHWQTLFAWARRRPLPGLPEPVARHFDTAADARVLAHCHWQPEPRTRPTIVLLHGLEGSSTVHYMRGMADKAWAEGWNVVRLNQRNCGGTEALSRGLYHSGLTHDPLFVIRELIAADGLPAIAVAGYSLGGNVALKLAGELGADAPPQLTAVCAVSPTMDLSVCVHALERRANYPYQWNFVRNLKGACGARRRSSPTSSRWSRWDVSGRCASSTRPIRPRTTASRTPPTTTTGRARCAESTASPCRP